MPLPPQLNLEIKIQSLRNQKRFTGNKLKPLVRKKSVELIGLET
jgi:hypothetical protein